MQDTNFKILSDQKISSLFRERNIHDFSAASDYIRQLPYKRNENKYDVATLFTDECGTCSTKHAVLSILASENGRAGVQLMLGIFKMKAADTPRIRKTLEQYGLEYMPEAHNYLRIDGVIADYTWPYNIDFGKDLLAEEEINPDQIPAYKVTRHRAFLKNWLDENKAIPYDLEALWAIREQCIRDLAGL